ncbi:MAG: TrkA family potassium uptake protein [Dehalococcoidales bacterium]|nr:TrkA family potassium uptake protein [Dehalococcoidales bacterium]
MSKEIAVIGLGRFGASLAETLQHAGYEVLAIDQSQDIIEGIASRVTHAVRANATNETALQKLGISSFDAAVVAVGASIQDSVMVTILLKKLGVRYIVARADNELHGDILASIGADKIVFPERDTALKIGLILTMRGVADFFPLDNVSGVIKAKAPEYFIGKTLGDVGFGSGAKNEAVVLMIQRGKEGLVNPSPQEVISHIDVLVIAGNNSDIERLLEQSDKTANGPAKSGDGRS